MAHVRTMKPNESHDWKPTTRQRRRQAVKLSGSHPSLHPSHHPSIPPFVHITPSPALRVAGVELRLRPCTPSAIYSTATQNQATIHPHTPARRSCQLAQCVILLQAVGGSRTTWAITVFSPVLGWQEQHPLWTFHVAPHLLLLLRKSIIQPIPLCSSTCFYNDISVQKPAPHSHP